MIQYVYNKNHEQRKNRKKMKANSTRNYLQQNLCPHFQEAVPSTSSSSRHPNPSQSETNTQMRVWLRNL